MMEPKKAVGMIQKYNDEKATLWASTLMKTVSLEAVAPEAEIVLRIATATPPMKKA